MVGRGVKVGSLIQYSPNLFVPSHRSDRKIWESEGDCMAKQGAQAGVECRCERSRCSQTPF